MVRSALSLLLVATLSSAGLLACSGAASTDFFDPVTDEASLTKTDPRTDGTKTKSPTASTKTDDPGDSTDDGVDEEDDTPHELPSPNGCPSEVESNDDEGHATTFETCINGVVDDAADTDFLRVVAPEGASVLHVRHEQSGKLVYRVSAEGRLPLPLPLPGDDVFSEEDATIKIEGGRAYLIRVNLPATWTGKKAARSYQIAVDFK